MTKILITGGTGLVGKRLCTQLIKKGYEVAILSRSKQDIANITSYQWSVGQYEIDPKATENTDYIIHLAGVNIGESRWTDEQKKRIISSRVRSTELIFEQVNKTNHPLKGFISSSATGYYGGITSDKIFKEEDVPANDFLGEVCQKWEAAADKFQDIGIRTVKIRTGVVVAKNEGALAKMEIPIKAGIGSPLGSGQQYMPWIHLDDLCNIYIKAIEDDTLKGAYNAVAPEHINNKEFLATLAKQLNRPFFFPKVPAFVLKTMLGEMSAIVLEGSRVSSDKIRSTGFEFSYPQLKEAFEEMYK